MADEETRNRALLDLADFELALDHKNPFRYWCAQGDEPESEDAGDRFDVLSALYLALWKVLGSEEFSMMMARARAEALRIQFRANR